MKCLILWSNSVSYLTSLLAYGYSSVTSSYIGMKMDGFKTIMILEFSLKIFGAYMALPYTGLLHLLLLWATETSKDTQR